MKRFAPRRLRLLCLDCFLFGCAILNKNFVFIKGGIFPSSSFKKKLLSISLISHGALFFRTPEREKFFYNIPMPLPVLGGTKHCVLNRRHA
jgi:hypothetical protein